MMQAIDELIKKEFPQAQDNVYLNHAGVSPWPQRTADAIHAFTNENVLIGATHYPRWMKTEVSLRKMLAELLNAPSSDDIALLKNTSEGLSVIAYGIDWVAGDNIVTSNQEFPSNRIVWESLKSQGVELRLVDLNSGHSPEDALITAMDERTRLLTISSVQYASGLKVNLKPLGDACQAAGTLFCVDAIQSLGITPFDVQAINADFVVADGHKWLMAPEGVAVFYCREKSRKNLKLKQYGWHMVEACGNYDKLDWQIASSARRFECGSPNMLGIHALHASLSLLFEVGIKEVEMLIKNKLDYLHAELSNIDGCKVVTDISADAYAGIISFRHENIPAVQLFPYLTQHKVVCAVRDHVLRFSPHFYTPQGKLERAVSCYRNAISDSRRN